MVEALLLLFPVAKGKGKLHHGRKSRQEFLVLDCMISSKTHNR
jgi:hypothetical protein